MIDIPTGLAAVLVAFLALVGTLSATRSRRVSQLERENRQLWFVCKRMLHLMYTNGIEPDADLVDLINGKDSS